MDWIISFCVGLMLMMFLNVIIKDPGDVKNIKLIFLYILLIRHIHIL